MKKTGNKNPQINYSFDNYSTKSVSYILVTKNRASLLEESLERSKDLKKKADELLVVDGNSSDNTLAVVNKYKSLIDKFISEPDLNPSHAVNKAILNSRGKYIKLLTDDDVVYSGAMKKAITVLENNPMIDILECGGVLYNSITKKTNVFYKPPGTNFGKNIDDMFRYRSNGLSLILRRKSLAKIGLFPMDPIADATFLINAFKNSALIKFCRIKLYKHVIHSENLSGRPEISVLVYNAIKKNSSKKYFLRYAINWHISKYPGLKFVLLPVLLGNNIFKKMSNKKLSTAKTVYKWDGGFS